ncbi:MAG: hypothetical protein HN348_23045 [Proteobacteria bacterium]|jgi:hypothetical protein|nr:hypothetical protein [Pseudomonadota bacterium]
MNFELRLEERHPKCVVVTVCIAPSEQQAHADGVSVQLFSQKGESLAPRLLLPISGPLLGSMVSRVELRTEFPIPRGSQVKGRLWCSAKVHEACCPTDPSTELQTHVRGCHALVPTSRDLEFNTLVTKEYASLSKLFSWIEVIEGINRYVVDDEEPNIEEIVSDYGLDGEDAAFLKELLSEE